MMDMPIVTAQNSCPETSELSWIAATPIHIALGPLRDEIAATILESGNRMCRDLSNAQVVWSMTKGQKT